jgi:hypothetical protein
MQSIPLHSSYLRSILILSSHLCLGLSSDVFPFGFSTKTVYPFIIVAMRATYSANLILHGFINLIIFGEECKRYTCILNIISILFCSLRLRLPSSLLFFGGGGDYMHFSPYPYVTHISLFASSSI